MSELTQEEKAVLAEVEAANNKADLIVRIPESVVRIPSRKSDTWTPELSEKLKILKSLVYKGLIRFDVDFDKRDYVFYRNEFI